MKKKLDKKVFAKYYWGIATDQEKKEIYESQESENMLQDHWNKSKKSGSNQLNHDQITREIHSSIKESKKKISGIRKLGSFMIKHAASILIPLITVGVLYFLLVMRPNMINQMTMVEKENPRGQRTEFILPDGSKVWLNAKSKIIYPEKFIGKYRTVNLEGEAFFEVTENKRKPFIVKTSDIDVEVLGTSFNVKSYSEDRQIKTTLVSGKVKVRRVDPKTKKVQTAILSPNHQAIYYKNQDKILLDQVDVTRYTSWRDGIIAFDNEPFMNVVKTLERWYDIDFIVGPELKEKYNYTITITEESLEDVLALIKKTTPKITIEQSDDTVKITY